MSFQTESILENSYNQLQQERNKIQRNILANETLDTAYVNGNLYVSSNYYNYIVYVFILLFLFFLLFRIGFDSQQTGGGSFVLEKTKYIGLLLLLSVIIIINAIIKNNS